ncbi:thioredoxin family protein [Sporosarcina siberiensis]|uniref:Thioredoxin family protein n=1 Tax=Sporosarcina siberiensis TaxID=1365606 RepID=A0ABW4SAZ4_9BACL
MKRIESYEAWLTVVNQKKPLLLFVKTDHCSVCDGLFPQVAALQVDYPISFYMVNIVEVPEIAGQLSLFSAPVVLLFNEGKEHARFARFVQMSELKYRITELIERGNDID